MPRFEFGKELSRWPDPVLFHIFETLTDSLDHVCLVCSFSDAS